MHMSDTNDAVSFQARALYVGFGRAAAGVASAGAVASYAFGPEAAWGTALAAAVFAAVWVWPVPSVVAYLTLRTLFEWGAVGGETASLVGVMVGVGLLLGAVARLVSDRVNLLRMPGIPGWAALAMSALISGLAGGRLATGLKLTGKLALAVVPYAIILEYMKTRRQFTLAWWAVVLSGLVPVIVATGQYLEAAGVVAQGYYRVFSTFSSFSKFGMHMGVVALLCLAAALAPTGASSRTRERSRVDWPGLGLAGRVGLAVLAGVCGLFMYLTYVRGCYIAFVLGAIAAAVFVRGARRMWLVMAAVAVAAGIAVTKDPSIVPRFTRIGQGSVRDDSVARRLLLWREGIGYFRSSPVLGKGPGFFRDMEMLDAHNDFVRVLAELGLVGFVALTWALLGAARSALRSARARAGPVYAKAGLFGALASLAVLPLSENVVFAVGTQTYFWSLVGLLAVSGRLRQGAPLRHAGRPAGPDNSPSARTLPTRRAPAEALPEGYERADCPACGSSDAALFAASPRKEGMLHWRRVRCGGCGLVYSDPVASAGTIKRFYERGFAEVYSYYVRQEERAGFRRMFKRQLDMLEKLGASGRLLEVGCSGGYFLELARTRGWGAFGIEASPELAECARKRGLEVQTGAFADVTVPDGAFDVVRMSHVLEHIRDIKGALSKARGALRAGGLVAISEPNLNFVYGVVVRGVMRVLGRVPHLPSHHSHTCDFTAKVLGLVLADCGFEVTGVDYYNPAGDDETYRSHKALKTLARGVSALLLPRMRRFFDVYALKR